MNLSLKNSIVYSIFLGFAFNLIAQTPLFQGVQVNNQGLGGSYFEFTNVVNSIDIDDFGNIYVAYRNSNGLWVAKSVDNGQSYLPSVLVTNDNSVPPTDILINHLGYVFLSWPAENDKIIFSMSKDGGQTFSTPRVIGIENNGDGGLTVSMATYGDNIFIVNSNTSSLFFNTNNGEGEFDVVDTPRNAHDVFTDVLISKEGRIYFIGDYLNLSLYEFSLDTKSFKRINLAPPTESHSATYTLNQSICGDYIFVGDSGFGVLGHGKIGYKVNINTGEVSSVQLGDSSTFLISRFLYSDNQGVLFDGYKSANEDLFLSLSYDQGESFETTILVENGHVHGVCRNPVTEDIVVVYLKDRNIYTTVYEDTFKRINLLQPEKALALCAGAKFNLLFVPNAGFTKRTRFRVALSDKDGDFKNAIEIGSITTTNIETQVECILPEDLEEGSNYKIRLEAVNYCVESNSLNIEIGTEKALGQLSETSLNSIYFGCLDENENVIGTYPVIETFLSPEDYLFNWYCEGNLLSEEIGGNLEVTKTGTYQVEIIDKETNCTHEISTFGYLGKPPKMIVEVLSKDFEKNQIIQVIPQTTGMYEYRLDNGSWQERDTFNTVSSGTHTVYLRDTYGCGVVQETITIVGFPSFFTPNGDGIHEYWNIEALKHQNAIITIFDRFGKLLKQIKTSGVGWDGTFNGNDMPQNDYWFRIEYQDLNTGAPLIFTSHFTLIR
ncbi:T9SS type B sorting domain-containing protein [Seonamhaeicola marinus]|uniref:T9SS type B sorting domain-containing protein n=1 Tax=Seonamhaeicola marinus TaxID=1912246 RepID=A0A5D0J7I9_9FLAO|nr:T9SS type B sorting domain-containing protein [Seonamhaeicola marinus]TYA92345.1 T9SS type B sorting domain-containing protein [Seonamhaeicola marinus]